MINYVIRDNKAIWAIFCRDEKTKDNIKGYNTIFKYFSGKFINIENMYLDTFEDTKKIKEELLKDFLINNNYII